MSTIYPLHLQRRFEQRWASRVVRDKLQRSLSPATSACNCGRSIAPPVSLANSPTAISVVRTTFRNELKMLSEAKKG